MKLRAALVIGLAAHGGVAHAACDDDIAALEDYLHHTDHVADPVQVLDGIQLVARDDLAPSFHSLTISISHAGFLVDLDKVPTLAALEKALAVEGRVRADPDWQKSKPGLAGHYGDVLLAVDASATWSDAVSVGKLAAKSGFTRVNFVLARAKQPVPPPHTSVDDLMAKASTTNERSQTLIKVRERLEQQCPGLAASLTHAKSQHDTYENTVVPAMRSWLSACHCSAPVPEVRSYLFYMFVPQLETGFITVELDQHARAIALPAHTLWRDAAPKLVAGKVWLVAK